MTSCRADIAARRFDWHECLPSPYTSEGYKAAREDYGMSFMYSAQWPTHTGPELSLSNQTSRAQWYRQYHQYRSELRRINREHDSVAIPEPDYFKHITAAGLAR